MLAIQQAVRTHFQQLFAKGYTATWFEREPAGGTYVLERSASRT
jgi:predicted GNAT superfamily acetyltransferase